jgi:hypothetical protein
MHREQLERRKRALGIEPGPDGGYSTKEIAAMVWGDRESEAVGKLREERLALERQRQIDEGELLPISTLDLINQKTLVPIRQRILSSALPEADRHEILKDIAVLGDLDWAKAVKEMK